MAELKPCPFCGGEAEMHFGEFPAEYAKKGTDDVPKDARIVRECRYPYREYWLIEYRRTAYIPRCKDTSCAGRLNKMFDTEQKAIEAWNRRADT